MKYVRSQHKKTLERRHWRHTFYTFSSFSIVDFEQVNVSWGSTINVVSEKNGDLVQRNMQ